MIAQIKRYQEYIEQLAQMDRFTGEHIHNLLEPKYTYKSADKVIRILCKNNVIIKIKRRTTGNRFVKGQGWSVYKVSDMARALLKDPGYISLSDLGKIYLSDWKEPGFTYRPTKGES